MSADPLAGEKDHATSLLWRPALTAYAAPELIAAADAIRAWLDGEGDDSEESALIERFRGAFAALRSAEGKA